MIEDLQKYRYLQNLLPETSKKRLVLITGARQTGKTTLARNVYPSLNYINLDAPENREMIREIASSAWKRDVGIALIDEAQKEPVVFEKIKYAFDAGDINFQVMLGSSQIQLLKNVRESLAGRVSIYELWPLMMKEVITDAGEKFAQPPLFDQLFSSEPFQQIFKKIPGVVFGEEYAIKKGAEEYLLEWGGMPALLNLTKEERIKWLRDYEYTYLERDLVDLARLNDLIPFRKLQKLAALRSGALLNYSELARDAALSVQTVRNYLQYLTISYQVVLLQPYYRNLTSSIVKSPKLYWLDIGLLRTLTGFWGNLNGSIYETLVVGEVVKWMRTTQKNAELFFYRTRSGLEVDMLLQTPSGFIGMEVKARNQVSATDITSLKKVANALGESWRGGLVIYRGDKIIDLGEANLWAVPSHRLFT
ncbi:MAG: ATP-binding protein [Calditrichia bacterium]